MYVSACKMLNHAPSDASLFGTGLLKLHKILLASNLISTTLFINANMGARGKAATNKVAKPNCKTESKIL